MPGSKLQLSLFDSAINNDPTINYSNYDNLQGSERNERRDIHAPHESGSGTECGSLSPNQAAVQPDEGNEARTVPGIDEQRIIDPISEQNSGRTH